MPERPFPETLLVDEPGRLALDTGKREMVGLWRRPRGRRGRGGVCDENAELERRFGFDCNLNKTSYG